MQDQERVRYVRLDIDVLVQGRTVKKDFDLEKDTELLTGLQVTGDLDDQPYARGTCGIHLGGLEIFPDNYQCKLQMSGMGVEPDKRYMRMALSPGNGKLSIHYTDHNKAFKPFQPYTVSVYARYHV